MFKHIDAHHHIESIIKIEGIYNTYKMSQIYHIDRVESDYKAIGVHPLYIDEKIEWDYIDSLLQNNSDLLIGEVGLDKRGMNRSFQEIVFKEFLNRGVRYNRSLSIHTVKTWGTITDIILEDFNRDIPHLFHGFSGSFEIFKRICEGNSFFSFSARELKNERIIRIIESIPITKLLIESDMLNEDFHETGYNNYLISLEESYRSISKIKKISIKDIENIIEHNFKRFVQRSRSDK